MRELDRIVEEGISRINAAVERVLAKWDMMPYGNGINDDAEYIQRILDTTGYIDFNYIDGNVSMVSKPLLLRHGSSVVGRSIEETTLNFYKSYRGREVK